MREKYPLRSKELKNGEGTSAVKNIIVAGIFVDVTVMHANVGRNAAGLCAVFKS